MPVDRALRAAARTDEDIARFLSCLAKSGSRHLAEDLRPVSFKGLSDWAVKNPSRARLAARRWAKGQATAEEIEKAANALAGAQHPTEQIWLLGAFGNRAYPLAPEVLIELAQSTDRQVSRGALGALKNVEHSAVRPFALNLGAKGARLLVRNYEPGDHGRILAWLRSTDRDEEFHSLAMDAWEFVKAHPHSTQNQEILEHLYEHNPCALCRESTVRLMIDRQILPPDVAAECAFDCHAEIRKLVTLPISQEMLSIAPDIA